MQARLLIQLIFFTSRTQVSPFDGDKHSQYVPEY